MAEEPSDHIREFLEQRRREVEEYFPNQRYRTATAMRTQKAVSNSFLLILASIFVACFFVVLSSFLFIELPPRTFPVGTVVQVEEGMTLSEIAHKLEEQGVIRRAEPLIFSVRYLYGGETGIVAGEYYFSKKLSLSSVARKIAKGDFGLDPIAITFPEGATVEDIADILEQELIRFDRGKFVREAWDLEGYLFPDTYKFLPNASPDSIVRAMNENFQTKIEELAEDIEVSGRTLDEIVIMASIVEKEAEDDDTARKKIAGVLWKRIEIGMPLQVDAVFPYIIGKNTFELTTADLEIDSPYNTYKYEGLPPGPIANPGLASIEATLEPIVGDYLFYLADRSGRTHFARNYEEHLYNKRRYLD